VIDPEGDYRALESLPGVIVLGGDDPLPTARDITRVLRYPDVSVVVDISRARLKEKSEYVRWLLRLLSKIRRETGLPHRIVVDEAHYFLHGPDVTELLDLELAGYTLITYQVSGLHSSILGATEAIIVTRETDSQEVAALHAIQGGQQDNAEWQAELGNLALNEAVLLPKTEEACGELCTFYVAPRLTAHTRHEHKYLDVPLPEDKAFIFTQNRIPTGKRARTLKEFTAIIASASVETLDGHLRNGDFSHWIGKVFRDNALAGQIRALETQYRVGQLPDVNDALIQAIQDRYKLSRQLGEISLNSTNMAR
jgi:hypothetical protein